MTITEEQWNTEHAEEIVKLAYEHPSGKPDQIFILGQDEEVVHELDKHMARAVAVRLVELAAALPEPPRILRRASDIDGDLRERDV